VGMQFEPLLRFGTQSVPNPDPLYALWVLFQKGRRTFISAHL
jgi:hypothetical protein